MLYTATAYDLIMRLILSLSALCPRVLHAYVQWDDEFLRLDGPELDRIPLKFASVNQVRRRCEGDIEVYCVQRENGCCIPDAGEKGGENT